MKARRSRRLILALAGAVALAAAGAFLLLRQPGLARLRNGRDFNVVLITLDTTRADRLGCYGFAGVETPTIDGLAARGVRFERCYAQTPLTLPSHTSIMTGTLPVFHGVRDNGGFIVPPQLTTMAELFRDKGYATGAFIAAYVLDSKWGLDQGFDTYFDQFRPEQVQEDLARHGPAAGQRGPRRGPALAGEEEGRRSSSPGSISTIPTPPMSPRRPTTRATPQHPYLGEIAFTDSLVGRVWQFLESNGLAGTTYVVIAGDHGESLWRARGSRPRVLRLSGGHPRPPDLRHAVRTLPGPLVGRSLQPERHPADGLRDGRPARSRRGPGTKPRSLLLAAGRGDPRRPGLQRDLLPAIPLRLVGAPSRPGRPVQADHGPRSRALRHRRRPPRAEEPRLPPEGRLRPDERRGGGVHRRLGEERLRDRLHQDRRGDAGEAGRPRLHRVVRRPGQAQGQEAGRPQGEDRRLQRPLPGQGDGPGRPAGRGHRDHPGDHRRGSRYRRRVLFDRQHLLPEPEVPGGPRLLRAGAGEEARRLLRRRQRHPVP